MHAEPVEYAGAIIMPRGVVIGTWACRDCYCYLMGSANSASMGR